MLLMLNLGILKSYQGYFERTFFELQQASDLPSKQFQSFLPGFRWIPITATNFGCDCQWITGLYSLNWSAKPIPMMANTSSYAVYFDEWTAP